MHMWNFQSELLADGCVTRVAVHLDSVPVSYRDVLKRWQADSDFRSMFIDLLAGSPYSAFRWETPPVTLASAGRSFEFVLIDSPGLARGVDVGAFAAHFNGEDACGVVEFQNLGKDAIMVAPCPRGPESAYGHIAAFLRHAPEAQKHALWQSVGAAMERRLCRKPVWLSTAGAGVSWLHVRLDDRPKYYGFQPYRQWHAEPGVEADTR